MPSIRHLSLNDKDNTRKTELLRHYTRLKTDEPEAIFIERRDEVKKGNMKLRGAYSLASAAGTGFSPQLHQAWSVAFDIFCHDQHVVLVKHHTFFQGLFSIFIVNLNGLDGSVNNVFAFQFVRTGPRWFSAFPLRNSETSPKSCQDWMGPTYFWVRTA